MLESGQTELDGERSEDVKEFKYIRSFRSFTHTSEHGYQVGVGCDIENSKLEENRKELC